MIVRLKGIYCSCLIRDVFSFNSMIVRLKDAGKPGPARYIRTRFNSMIVRLKEKTGIANLMGIVSRFNSMIVRLKAYAAGFTHVKGAGFNSMIVRLKVFLQYGESYFQLFQFYDSPIKRAPPCRPEHCPLRFQFYDSPIKSTDTGRERSEADSFNSMIVRLKASLHRQAQTRTLLVSIL